MPDLLETSAVPTAGSRNWNWLIDLGLMLGFVALTWGGVLRSVEAQGAFWPANGLMTVLMLRLCLRRRFAVMAGVGVLAAALNIALAVSAGHTNLIMWLVWPVLNVVEALGVALLMIYACGRQPDFTSLPRLARLAFLVVLPGVGAVVAVATTGSLLVGDPVTLTDMLNAWTGDTLGILMTAPVLVTILSPRTAGLFHRRRIETAGLFVLLFAAESVLFAQSSLPALFLVFPFLMAISFRLGPVAAAYAVMGTGVIAFGCTMAGFGPLPGLEATTPAINLLLQTFILATLCMALPAAGAVEEQLRLRGQLLHREAQALAASAEARRAAAAKADFLATMSHELRTPLNSIFGFSQLLGAQTDLGVETRRRVELIEDATRSLLTVVNDILDYSKIEAGKIELCPQPFDLGDFSRASVHMVRQQAEAKGLELTCIIAPEATRWFNGDDSRLRQVLLNLLGNAVKFTPHGSVRLQVGLDSADATTGRVRFRVEDTGPGVPAEKLDRLFQRFSQVDNSTSRNFGGTGLGLAICKQLIELMGGEIGVESVEGEGSTFWFVVPLPFAEAQASEMRAEDNAPLNVRVLVVDDVPVNREIARLMLTIAGCEVVEADSGAAAVEAARCEVFDIILMDLQMPGMDGIAATREIRGLGGEAARTPIIAMTANVMQDQVQFCLASGMDGHLGKPFRQADLIDTVRRFAIRRTDIPAASAAAPPETPHATVFDPEPLAQMGVTTGSAIHRSLLISLGASLEVSFLPELSDPGARAALAHDAHALVSAAGSLGFLELSEASRTLQHACEDTTIDPTDALDRARQAVARAQEVLIKLTAGGERAASGVPPFGRSHTGT